MNVFQNDSYRNPKDHLDAFIRRLWSPKQPKPLGSPKSLCLDRWATECTIKTSKHIGNHEQCAVASFPSSQATTNNGHRMS